MKGYIVEELGSGAVYIFGIESISEISGVFTRPGYSKEEKKDIRPLGLIKFDTFHYKVHGPTSKWARENEPKPKVDKDGRFVDYKDTVLPLKNGKPDCKAYLEFESDDDAKLFAEVLHNEYLSKKGGEEDD